MRKTSDVVSDLKIVLMGGNVPTKASVPKAMGVSKNRSAVIDENRKKKEDELKTKTRAMAWRISLAILMFCAYFLPLVLYVAPAVIVFFPILLCMITTQLVWIAIFSLFTLSISSFLVLVLRCNRRLALSFLKKEAVVTAFTACIVVLPQLMYPLVANTASFYEGVDYFETAPWFMWNLKSIWLADRDPNFEVPLLDFTNQYTNLPNGRLALSLSSLAIYLETLSLLLHQALRRILV